MPPVPSVNFTTTHRILSPSNTWYSVWTSVTFPEPSAVTFVLYPVVASPRGTAAPPKKPEKAALFRLLSVAPGHTRDGAAAGTNLPHCTPHTP